MVKGGGLVGVFAIAQHRRAVAGDDQAFGIGDVLLVGQPAGDGRVIGGGAGIGNARQAPAGVGADAVMGREIGLEEGAAGRCILM